MKNLVKIPYLSNLNKKNQPNLLLGSVNQNQKVISPLALYLKEKGKNELSKRVKENNQKLFSPENLKFFMDFLVHARLAQDNIEMIRNKKLITDDKIIRKQLDLFFKYFKSIESDFEIMEKKDFKDTNHILDEIYSLVEEIAFLRLPYSEEFHSVICIANAHKEKVKEFTDYQLKNGGPRKKRKFDSMQLVTRNLMMLAVNLLFCKQKVTKFIELQQYNTDKIITYIDKTIDLLTPVIMYRSYNDFDIEISNKIVIEYQCYVDKLSEANTAAKMTFNQIVLTYQKCPTRFINYLKKL